MNGYDVHVLELTGRCQSAEDASEILADLHRGEGYLAFAAERRFNKPEWIALADVRTWFPSFIRQFLRDSYTTVNTFARATRRTNQNVAFLDAAYVDLDCYKLGIDWPDCLHAVNRMIADDVIPEPSITGRSGAGVWVFWSLCSHNAEPLKATRENVTAYRRIQRQLCKLFTHLGADQAAKDPARYCRAPGSWHVDAAAPVVWLPHWVDFGEARGLPQYTPEQMMHTLDMGILAEPLPPIEIESPPKGKTPKARKTAVKRIESGEPPERTEAPELEDLDVKPYQLKRGRAHAKERAILEDLRELVSLRGGVIREGTRQMFAWAWFYTLYMLGLSEDDAKLSTWRLVKLHFAQPAKGNAKEPYTRADILGLQPPPARDGEDRRGLWRHDELALRLEVTPHEAADLKTILPAEVRAERRAADEAAIEQRRQERRARRLAIEAYVRKNPRARGEDVAALVREDLGISCCGRMVNKVRAELGLPNNRRGPRRTKR